MPGLIQSIERSSAVLRLLAAGPGRLRVKEIADALGLPKSTAQSILRTLTAIGFAEQDPRTARYRLGRGLLDLASTGLDANQLRAGALNWADALASRSGEQVHVGALGDGGVLIVHHVFRPDDSAQSMDTGSVVPAHATALGKVLLAYRAAAAEDLAGSGLDAYTRRTVTTRPALARALAETRAQGWSLSVEEWQADRAGIAAPLRSYGGLVIGAIGISGPVERLCDTRRQARPALVEHVVAAARAITRDLAGP
ncbi:IclR family transcriptional regulator [Actinoplanes cyaneus]|uniref:Glycerol operon regulatory protein n=1 Tax=Actinoplanes cyaneus TaxID=52696 RepID=A0A919IQ22_9ACTN|nr:IclR family transcriptional regulator [Actinoplanes cyaneus]MCW2140854.1 transcriptional regulator, IclR family [Actinoplanes cyaneus]GID69106.1 IclR family transcriptional regulator [Actinoplanes cyaneus]